jgi:predicted enzyme related to lactoylglutathione lyase
MSAADLFREGLAAFRRGDLDAAAVQLRAGFFANLYIAPLLLGDEAKLHPIWSPGPAAAPEAAREYVARFGDSWQEGPEGLSFLRQLWNDPSVRNEIKSFVNVGKSLARARNERQRVELQSERSRFMSVERIKRTQQGIVERITRSRVGGPVARPHLGLVMLSAQSPAESVQFFRKLFQIEPTQISQVAGGYAEFDLDGVSLAIHGYNQHGHGDPYGLGPPPRSLGWGAFFVIRVKDFDRYFENAIRAGIDVIDRDTDTRHRRFFVVKDPSGYVLEITEEELRGLPPRR